LRARWIIALVATGAAAGCGPRAASRTHGSIELPRGADDPYDLADDNDLALVRADHAALPPGDPARVTGRRRLIAAFGARLGEALQHGRRTAAHDALRDLLSLWTGPELRAAVAGRDLVPQRDAIERARVMFARAGADVETVTALAALMLLEPQATAQHRADIDEVFAYADDLAVAENGPGSERARPIEILEQVVEVHPAPWAIDRLVTLYVERQRALDAHFRRGGGASMEIIRAHGDGVIRTAWNIVRVLALAGRIEEAPEAAAQVTGIGDDPQLRERLRRALGPDATAPDWVLLAARYHSPDPDNGDFAAALALAREGVRRFPMSPIAHLAAAESARQLGEETLAIALFEDGLARDREHEEASERLAELYVQRIDLLAKSHRPRASAAVLHRFEDFHRRAERALGRELEPDRADALAAYGRGLVGLGELRPGTAALERSIDLRPTMNALEALGALALKREDHGRAIDLFERALAAEARGPLDRYQQCRILRLLAEAYAGDGRQRDAAHSLRRAMIAWHRLTEDVESMPAQAEAESLVEQGKVLWGLGHQKEALAAFDAAIDADDEDASSHSDVVAFLIVHGHYDRALDAYHRALGNADLGDTSKVYMSLWVIAEAQRQRRTSDPIAREFLAGRDGSLWYDDLARFAAGRIGAGALEARATTRARRAELLYYSAVLGDELYRHPGHARRLLEGVVESGMVHFFEYDMAKHWLKSDLRLAAPRK
jgi:tetratricopeptide (TPR) repeat protein